MMEKIDGVFVYYCDGCSDMIELEEDNFSDADKARKEKGWICFKDQEGDWCHYCTDCQKKQDGVK